eukprot:scaffold42741_cov343-Skeletonema_marinoi.AAC.1
MPKLCLVMHVIYMLDVMQFEIYDQERVLHRGIFLTDDLEQVLMKMGTMPPSEAELNQKNLFEISALDSTAQLCI